MVFIKSAVVARMTRLAGLSLAVGCPAHAIGVSISRQDLSARPKSWPKPKNLPAMYLKVSQVLGKGFRGSFEQHAYAHQCAAWAVFANRVWLSQTQISLVLRLLSRCTVSVVCARAKCIGFKLPCDNNVLVCIAV